MNRAYSPHAGDNGKSGGNRRHGGCGEQLALVVNHPHIHPVGLQGRSDEAGAAFGKLRVRTNWRRIAQRRLGAQ